ncbi:MAG: TolC family protein [Bacteroidetes bacterium]|nr:TolC family protein [Bacteroidota bacterium]
MKTKLSKTNYRIRNTILVSAILLVFTCQAQQPLTLDECYKLTEKNYPLKSQIDLIANANTLKVTNLNKNYLPQINVNGSVSLQSAVTQVAIELPKGFPELSMPVMSKDWYKLTLDVNQSIFDGNVTSYQKKVESYNLQSDQKGVEIELYKLKDRINQFFFSILLINQNDRLLKSNKERIDAKLKEVESAISNGAALEMNADLLRAELVRIDQQLTETRMDRVSLYLMLSELTSTTIPETTPLITPEISLPSAGYENNRLEYKLYDIQRAKIDVMKNMVTTKWNPKIFAYGQAGFGRPGLNMLDDSFKPWWLFGAKLTWNPWNWNGNKNEKKILSLQSEILKSQQETFDKNLKISSQKELSEMNKVMELLVQDQQIIDIRIRIAKTASSQLDNGVITSSDYIARLNEETLARLNLEIHKIQLIKAKLSYLYALGKL